MEEQANYKNYQLEMVDVREEFQTQYIKEIIKQAPYSHTMKEML
jgi:hypothetical protein